MERVERSRSVSHCLLRYLQQGGVAFLTYPAHLHVTEGAISRPRDFSYLTCEALYADSCD